MLTTRRRDELEHAVWFLRYVADRAEARGCDDAEGLARMRGRADEIERAIHEGRDILHDRNPGSGRGADG